MRLKKQFELALNTLIHSKLRSWLTIIGIIIGIGSVVAILSVSQGAQKQMEEQLSSMGTNRITITPGFTRAQGFRGGGPEGGNFQQTSSSSSSTNSPVLKTKDLLAISLVKNVEKAIPKISSNEELVYSSKKASVSITAIKPEDWDEIVDEELDEGRALLKSDTFAVVIGSDLATKTFEGIGLNRQLTINGKTFRVVGILESGRGAYIPLEISYSVFDNDLNQGEYDTIIAIAKDANLIENTTQDIKYALMLSRGILFEKNIDFSVSNMLSMQETISESLNTISLFLGAIAAISLLVGGIGIANTLFTSVLEKTKEIGILKAIGAKNSDILMIFLMNSGLIGFVGGLGGIILGSFASLLVSSYAGISTGSVNPGRGMMAGLGSNVYISPSLIFLALSFAIIIGMIAGIIPAYRASKLKPVDALRYE